MAEDVESPAEGDDLADSVEHPTGAVVQNRSRSGPRLAFVVGVVMVVVVAGLAGWLGFGAWRADQADQQRELFLRVARQSAVDMTTISHTEIDTDVQRILDASTGTFHDDFAKRIQPFTKLIKRDQSTSQGTVTEAGLVSVRSRSARALVAVSVKLSTADAPEQRLDGFRIRMDLQRVGDGAKVSDVEYVQ